MKNIFILIFICSAIQLQAQPDLSAFKDFEVNRCFASYPLDINNLDTFYIELVPPVFESYKEQLNKTEIARVSVDAEQLRVEITPETFTYVKRPVPRDCLPLSTPVDKVILFCVANTEAKYQVIESVCVEENGKKFLIPSKENIIIERQRVVQEAQIRVISKEDALHSTNETYAVVGGQWDEWREVICPTCNGLGGSLIAKLQRALINEGYEIKIDGVLSKTMREALIDFQKKNNLPVGRLDIETLKKLGVNL